MNQSHINKNKSEESVDHSNSSQETAIHNEKSIGSRLAEVVDKRLILGFTPVYFVSIMGSGISSAILYNFPYPAQWLRVCSYIMFACAVIFWITTTVFYFVSVFKFPKKFIAFNCDPAVAPFMGCYAMGYNTIVNYIYLLTGKSWIIGTYCLWWIAVILSLYCSLIVFFFALISKHKNTTKKLDPANLHATLLLPIVTLTVAASLGNIFALDLPTNNLIFSTMIITYILWSVAISMAFVIIAVYFWKLFVHKIPATGAVFTLFLPVGVLGQGAYCIGLFGSNMYKFINENADSLSLLNVTYIGSEAAMEETKKQLPLIIGSVILYSSTMMSLFLTSFGYFCTFIAVISCLSKISPFTKTPNQQFAYKNNHPIKSKLNGMIRFFKAFWAMTFPLGTMSLSNNELHKIFNNMKAFRVVGAMYGALLLIITTGCILGCIYATIKELNYIVKGDEEEIPKKEIV